MTHVAAEHVCDGGVYDVGDGMAPEEPTPPPNQRPNRRSRLMPNVTAREARTRIDAATEWLDHAEAGECDEEVARAAAALLLTQASDWLSDAGPY